MPKKENLNLEIFFQYEKKIRIEKISKLRILVEHAIGGIKKTSWCH
jgi:hypothetical protein